MSLKKIQLCLFALAIAVLLATLADPKAELEQPTYRYVFVYDISQSMNVTDVPGFEGEISRLEFAKKASIESLPKMPCGTEIGLALFTGHRAFLLLTPVEVCANQLELSSVIGNVDWNMTWKLRSEVAKGIHKSLLLLAQLPKDTRLAFFTDGQEAPPLHPDLAPTFTGEIGKVSGMIVGVGGEQLVPIPKFDKNGERQGDWKVDDVTHVDAFTASQNAREGTSGAATGTEHLSSLKESYLASLASSIGLKYHRIDEARKFSQKLLDREMGIPRRIEASISWIFALAALALLVAAMVLPRFFSSTDVSFANDIRPN